MNYYTCHKTKVLATEGARSSYYVIDIDLALESMSRLADIAEQ